MGLLFFFNFFLKINTYKQTYKPLKEFIICYLLKGHLFNRHINAF